MLVARPEPGRAGDWWQTTHTGVRERTRAGRRRTGSSAKPRRRAPPYPLARSRRHTNHPRSPRCSSGNSRYRGQRTSPGRSFPGCDPGGRSGPRGALTTLPSSMAGAGDTRCGLSAARCPWRRRHWKVLPGSGGRAGQGSGAARQGTGAGGGGAAAALGRNNKGALGGRAVLRDAPRACRPPCPPPAPPPRPLRGGGRGWCGMVAGRWAGGKFYPAPSPAPLLDARFNPCPTARYAAPSLASGPILCLIPCITCTLLLHPLMN